MVSLRSLLPLFFTFISLLHNISAFPLIIRSRFTGVQTSRALAKSSSICRNADQFTRNIPNFRRGTHFSNNPFSTFTLPSLHSSLYTGLSEEGDCETVARALLDDAVRLYCQINTNDVNDISTIRGGIDRDANIGKDVSLILQDISQTICKLENNNIFASEKNDAFGSFGGVDFQKKIDDAVMKTSKTLALSSSIDSPDVEDLVKEVEKLVQMNHSIRESGNVPSKEEKLSVLTYSKNHPEVDDIWSHLNQLEARVSDLNSRLVLQKRQPLPTVSSTVKVNNEFEYFHDQHQSSTSKGMVQRDNSRSNYQLHVKKTQKGEEPVKEIQKYEEEEVKSDHAPDSQSTTTSMSSFAPLTNDSIATSDEGDSQHSEHKEINETTNKNDINSNQSDSDKKFNSDYNEIYDKMPENVESFDTNVEEVDIAIVGAGVGGLCAGAILNTLYGKTVGIYESHYLPGGCAHAFDRVANIRKDDGTIEKQTFTFDSGPTIVLGCSTKPFNPLRQVLNAVGKGDDVEWLPYNSWGMIENPGKQDSLQNEKRWSVELGPDKFAEGPVLEYGGTEALREFNELKKVTEGLVSSAIAIPAMAMRCGDSALIPLLRYLPALVNLIKQGDELTRGTFDPYMNGPIFTVTNKWLRDWLDALAFSLSGLPASRTSAAAMAYVLYDMHRDGAALDYPRGGLGSVIDALVHAVQQGDNGSKVNLRNTVASIDSTPDGSRITGLTLVNGKVVKAKDGVIYNAPVWSLEKLLKNDIAKKILNKIGANVNKIQSSKETLNKSEDSMLNSSWVVAHEAKGSGGLYSYIKSEPKSNINNDLAKGLLNKCKESEMTGSFLHLHLALNSTGLDLDKMHAHYTVMDRGLSGDDDAVFNKNRDGPCGECNMIAVSNPCVLDDSLAPKGYIVIHAYAAGNEPYEIWESFKHKRNTQEYQVLKKERSEVLWRAVESVIPDVRQRVVLDMLGSPLTHERFLRRPKGTYGSATEDYLLDGRTSFDSLVLCGDGIFPGIGIPAVALNGASAANSMIGVFDHWKLLNDLKKRRHI